MPCPFGFHGDNPHVSEDDADEYDATGEVTKSKEKDNEPRCPLASMAEGDDRFDITKDPISWFYQNQIKSEEEFQAKKEQLRAAARHKLDEIFEKKGKHLIVDSDDEGFSIGSSELSAWDSDVYSIRTLASCANSWAEEVNFTAPALTTLKAALLATLAAVAYCGWKSLQAFLNINRYWGVILHGWVPTASLVLASIAVCAVGVFWYVTDSKNKAGLLGAQIAMHVLCAFSTGLAMLCWVFPSKIDSGLQASACQDGGTTTFNMRLCQYLPMIQEQIVLAMNAMMLGNALTALATLASTCAGSWHFWELSFVEKKAAKHKRRRRHRKRSIPWEKIKIENIGPVTYCGGPPPVRAAAAAAAAATAAATTQADVEGKKTV